MPVRAYHCESCGAPLPTDGRRRSVRCRYCNALLRIDDDVVKSAGFLEALAQADADAGGSGSLPIIEHAGRRYRVLGRIGSGESSDVFAAEWCRAATERVLLKVPRSRQDDDLLEREWRVLSALQRSSAPGSAELARRVPQPVAFGALREGGESGRPAMTLRYLSGFAHTLVDVRAAHPRELDARHAVWLWRRLLEVLGFAHASGLVHGAVLPEHLVIHARDHGVMLVGWACAVGADGAERLPAVSERRLEFYPRAAIEEGAGTVAGDLVMAARVVAWALGAEPGAALSPSVPRRLAALLDEYRAADDGRVPIADAHALGRRVAEVAQSIYGPPSYAHLSMPGWR